MDKISRKKILSQITPTIEEHEAFMYVVKHIIRKLKKSARLLEIKCDFFIGGSFGKNTYLKGKSDVDIFIRFDMNYQDSELSYLLEQILESTKIVYKKQKGSRDYFSAIIKKKKVIVNFEFVPTRKIKEISDMLNSTDVSFMHVNFVKENIEKNPILIEEIRLAKQFFKAKRLYGAESYIGGFSGHVIDILICYYGSLEKLLENVRNWDFEQIIDVSNFYENSQDILQHIDKSKISSLIVVDPVLKNRNAARALEIENYARFVFIASRITQLSLNDFQIEKEDLKQYLKDKQQFAKDNNLKCLSYEFKFNLKNISEDIAGSKLQKLFRKLQIYFESYEFRIFESEFKIDIKESKCIFVYLFEKQNLPILKKIVGPNIFIREGVKNFIKKYPNFFINGEKLCVYEKRVFMDLKEISKFKLEEFEKLLNKDLGYITSFKKIYK